MWGAGVILHSEKTKHTLTLPLLFPFHCLSSPPLPSPCPVPQPSTIHKRQTEDSLGCTRAELFFQGRYEINLPSKSHKITLKHVFAPLKLAQKTYERCDEIDELKRNHFAKVTMKHAPAPNALEKALLLKSLEYTLSDDRYKRIRGTLMTYPTIQMFIREDANDEAAWGKSYGDIDESPELVLAYNWFVCSYERTETHRRSNGALVRRTDATETSRTQMYEVEMTLATGIASRCFTSSFTWFKLDPSVLGREAYAMTIDREKGTQDSPFTPKAVAGTSVGIFLFERVAPRITKFTMIQQVDLNGHIPTWLMNSLAVYGLGLTLEVQNRFRRANKVMDKVRRLARVSHCVRFTLTPSFLVHY